MNPIQAFTATRRNLPHWQDPGAIYFLTWNTLEGLNLEPEDRTMTLNAIRHWDALRWELHSTVVMPDHVHVLAQMLPLEPDNPVCQLSWNLSELLKSVKGFSSRSINNRKGRIGSFWQDESFDRIVRDGAEFEEKWNYIRNNPVKSGLVERPEEYEWLYESPNSRCD
jgi:REP element-mobilizing transposase RayT